MTKEINITKPEKGKMDTFYGDRSVVIPKKHLNLIKKNPKFGNMYLMSIGYYPYARNHFRKRKKGIDGCILIYCVNGKGSILINDKVHNLSPNSYFFIKNGQPHEYWASKESPWSIYWITFGGERSNYFIDNMSGKVSRISAFFESRVGDRIQFFNELLTSLESGFTKEIIEYTNLNLTSLLASFFYEEIFYAAKGIKSLDPVDQSIIFMQKNINKPLKLKDIAENVKLSESYFSKIFKNKTSSAPMNYFISLKMQEAIRLLSNHSLNNNEIAFLLGYDDPFYFSRTFKKHIGSSPTLFLKHSRLI